MKRFCPRCGTSREDTRLVAMVETGSGTGGMFYACRDCVPHCPLDDEDPRAPRH